MQSTSSVAQGSFLFMPDGFSLSKYKKSKKRKLEELSKDRWEIAFNKIWEFIDQQLREINEELFTKVLQDLIGHLKKLHNEVTLGDGVIPCEILITGTNLPDHKLLLSTLTQNINKEITPFVAELWSWNCNNIKNIIQNLVSHIVPFGKYRRKNNDDDDNDEDNWEEDGENSNESNSCDEIHNENDKQTKNSKIHFQVSQYNLSTLSSWYSTQCTTLVKSCPIVIIIPDFEGFLPNVLGEFILLLSAYSSRIPFILIFGVATTPVAVYQNLSRKVLSQLGIQVFRSEPSTTLLNNVIENVFFSEKCPFRLGSKCMTFLTDIFLFHSFSVHDFVQGFKYCLMEHFYKRNHFSLCSSNREHVEEQGRLLTADEVENIRKLPSFQKYVENSSMDDRKMLLLDDDHTKIASVEMINKLQLHTKKFHIGLRILHILASDIPKNPLGRYVREYYCKAVSSTISETLDYKETIKLLELLSYTELTLKINNLITFMSSVTVNDELNIFREVHTELDKFKTLFNDVEKNASDREEKTDGPTSFDCLRKKFLDYIQSVVVADMLKPPFDFPLHEILYFDNLPAVRRRISGTPRGAIHLALNNPQCYLNCECCKVHNPEDILSTFPDLSIAYKIHLECNKIINMYDWLQSFAASISQKDSKVEGEINEEIQARFTRAVSELQFLGFIKPSRAKVDHVSRLTWGNC